MQGTKFIRIRVGLPIVALLALSIAAAACRPPDPRAEVRKQRSRWTVDLLSWVAAEDDQISLTLRLSGPPNSTLKELTFRVSLLDAVDDTLAEIWRTADLSEVARGGPKDMFFTVDPGGHRVEGLAVSLVLNPTPEQELQIKELQPRPAGGG